MTWDTTGIAFYGASAIAQPTRVGQLTDSTGGSANATCVAIAGTGDDANINNNFADVIAKLNAIDLVLSQAGGGLGLTA